MKLIYVLLITLPLNCHAFPADSLEPISVEDNANAESETDSKITKRSGSLDLVTSLKTGLLSGLGRASASIASGSSGGSSGYKSIDVPHGNSIDFDPWTLKKSVLNTIFQAVKAITGGVTALKGQLIKGSGYALSAGGKLVAASGDKVTDVGKAIIHSAQLIPPGHGHGAVVHPFSKFSSLSGASSSSSSGGHAVGPVVHTETITSYDIPAGHASYGPPSKPPAFSSATHQYLPPAVYGGGQPFTGHAAYEDSPTVDFLSSKYGVPHDGHDDFLSYGISPRKPTPKDAVKAAEALKEILHLLPQKTQANLIGQQTDQTFNPYPEHVDLQTYGGAQLGPIETIQHTESITASYGPPKQTKNTEYDSYPQSYNSHPSEVYRQMAAKPKSAAAAPQPQAYELQQELKYANYHNQRNSLNELTPAIVAALEVRNGQRPKTPSSHRQPQKGYNYPHPPPPSSYHHQNRRRGAYYDAPRQAAKTVQITRPRYQIADPLRFNRDMTL